MTTQNTDALRQLMQDQLTDLLNNRVADLAQSLSATADGKLTVSISVKLVMTPQRVHSNASLSYGVRHRDTTDDSVAWEDPNQGKLGI